MFGGLNLKHCRGGDGLGLAIVTRRRHSQRRVVMPTQKLRRDYAAAFGFELSNSQLIGSSVRPKQEEEMKKDEIFKRHVKDFCQFYNKFSSFIVRERERSTPNLSSCHPISCAHLCQ